MTIEYILISTNISLINEQHFSTNKQELSSLINFRHRKLKWQMSTPISQSRADLAPVLAERYRNILQDLGEDSEREGLLDTPLRAAKALLFFTKVSMRLRNELFKCS